jgi:hypothetical protein
LTRKVAIVGSHPATRELAPYDDPSWQIWLFNEAAQKPEIYRRWDAILQLHLPEVYSSPNNWVNLNHWEWLQQDHGPNKTIWMQKADPRVPNSREYPLDAVLHKIHPFKYLRSTPAMALGLAAFYGFDVVALYGSELTSNTEYGYQATNMAFWIGFLKGQGIEFDLECWHSEFLEQPIYGYEGELQLSPDYFRERVKEIEPAYHTNQRAYTKIMDDLSTAMLESKHQKVKGLLAALESLVGAAGETAGQLGEAKRYIERGADHISRQEFERVSAKAQQAGEGLKSEMYHLGGICEYVWNVWAQTGRGEALQQLRQFAKDKAKKAFDMGEQHGVFQENIRYMGEYDKRLTAAGGVRALGR